MTSVRTLPVRGLFTQGQPIDFTDAGVAPLPGEFTISDEYLLRVETDIPAFSVRAGDVLGVDLRPRGNAESGELVLVNTGQAVWFGRWWQRGGRRLLLDADMQPLLEDVPMRVVGAVLFVTRRGD